MIVQIFTKGYYPVSYELQNDIPVSEIMPEIGDRLVLPKGNYEVVERFIDYQLGVIKVYAILDGEWMGKYS